MGCTDQIAADERERCAVLVEQMMTFDRSIYRMPSVRMALTIAARAIRRGRHLTAREQLSNIEAALDEAGAERD